MNKQTQIKVGTKVSPKVSAYKDQVGIVTSIYPNLALPIAVTFPNTTFEVDFKENELIEITEIECFICGDVIPKEHGHIWYHDDQDDLICTNCAKKVKHTDTWYAGMGVLQ